MLRVHHRTHLGAPLLGSGSPASPAAWQTRWPAAPSSPAGKQMAMGRRRLCAWLREAGSSPIARSQAAVSRLQHGLCPAALRSQQPGMLCCCRWLPLAPAASSPRQACLDLHAVAGGGVHRGAKERLERALHTHRHARGWSLSIPAHHCRHQQPQRQHHQRSSSRRLSTPCPQPTSSFVQKVRLSTSRYSKFTCAGRPFHTHIKSRGATPGWAACMRAVSIGPRFACL